MSIQILKIGQCLVSNLGDHYVISEVFRLEKGCNYRLLSLDVAVVTTLSHGVIMRSGWALQDRIMSRMEIKQRIGYINSSRKFFLNKNKIS
ncbi:hypothetical protein [Xenorhabdus sp. SGI246]|uniref:hypothetical protein n=1 Tax=Xenorhabdus sp. SGI246 TaxID=3158263 RepID=UPI00349F63A1